MFAYSWFSQIAFRYTTLKSHEIEGVMKLKVKLNIDLTEFK